MDATSRLTNALHERGFKIKSAGPDTYRAQCPAHQGQDLNLSVAKGDQGVLVKCWSHDCAEADIASAVGLAVTDLFDTDGRAMYDYGGGHRVYRTRTGNGKKIRQENAPQTTNLWQPDGSTLITESPIVLLAEGEKTADALLRMGAPCAATWPGGSSGVGKVDLSPLTGKKVVLIPDNDEPGEKAAATLMWRLQKIASEVSVLRVPVVYDAHRLNDAADLLLAGGSLDDLSKDAPIAPLDPEFEDAVKDAQFREAVKWEALRRERARRDSVVSTKLTPRPLGEIVTMDWKHDWVVPGLLERGDRLVVTGTEGFGKSILLRQIAICAAAGIHPFTKQRIEPIRVLVIDAENSERQWSRGARYITTFAQNRGSVDPTRSVMVSAGVRVDLTTAADANQIHRLIDEHRPDVLYIGPLYKLVPRAVMTDDDAAPLIETLDGFRERGLCLLMEAHAGHSRGSGGDRDMRPRGSAALLGWPEFGFGLTKHEDADDLAWFSAWRGQREVREWPVMLRKGVRENAELQWEIEVPGKGM